MARSSCQVGRRRKKLVPISRSTTSSFWLRSSACWRIGAHIGAAARRRRLYDRDSASQPVAGIDGLEPAQLVDARRTQARFRRKEVVDPHPHHHGRRVPAACAEAAEDRCLAGFVIEMERLRVVAPRKTDDLLLGHLVAAELEHLSRRQILEVIDVQGHCSFPSLGRGNGDILHFRPEIASGARAQAPEMENCPHYRGRTVVSLMTVTVTEELIDWTKGSFDR